MAHHVADGQLAAKFAAVSAKYAYSWDLYEKLSAQYGLQTASVQAGSAVNPASGAQALANQHAQTVADDSDDDIVFQPRRILNKAAANLQVIDSDCQSISDSEADSDASSTASDDVRKRALRGGNGHPQPPKAVQRQPKAQRYIEQEAQLSGSDEEGDEEEEGDDEYGYDDGFLVNEDEEEEEEEEEEGALEGAGEEGEEEEEDTRRPGVLQLDEDDDEDVVIMPAASIPSTPRGAVPRPTSAAVPVGTSASVRAKGRAKPVTVIQPFNLSTATRCAACTAGTHGHGVKSGGCEYARLRDGDKEPGGSGRVFIREEYERSLRTTNGAFHGAPGGAQTPRKQAVPPSPVATPSGSSGVLRHAFRNKAHRDGLTASLYAEYDARVFNGALGTTTANGSEGVSYTPLAPVEWGARLTKTAGMTYTKRSAGPAESAHFCARIVLSVKVLDSPYKLAQTLLHEMCHAAAWLVDHSIRPPHGAVFQAWARKGTAAYPARAVTVCHNYEIQHKFRYQCQYEPCGYIYGRHSKSLDTARNRCGMCQGKGALMLLPVGGAPRAGPGTGAAGGGHETLVGAAQGIMQGVGLTTPVRQPSEYQRYMASERKSVASAMPGATQPMIMAEVARRWNARKAAMAAGQAQGQGGVQETITLDDSPTASITLPSAVKAARSGLLGSGSGWASGAGLPTLPFPAARAPAPASGTGTGAARGAGCIDLTTPGRTAVRSHHTTHIEVDEDEDAAAGGEQELGGYPHPSYTTEGGLGMEDSPQPQEQGGAAGGVLQSSFYSEQEQEDEYAPGHVSPDPIMTYSKRKPGSSIVSSMRPPTGAGGIGAGASAAAALGTVVDVEEEGQEGGGLLGGLMRRLSSALTFT